MLPAQLSPYTMTVIVSARYLVCVGIWSNAEGVPELEENFEEAILHVNTALQPANVSAASVCLILSIYSSIQILFQI